MEKKTTEQYTEEIRNSINWEKVKTETETNTEETEDGIKGSCFIGRVMSLAPSGKYYTPFANSNVEEDEADEDQKYFEALGQVAEEKGYYIESGEGDPTDLFICKFTEV